MNILYFNFCLDRCREKAPGPLIGGPLVDQAVNSVFAALVWHSQELRDQIVLFGKKKTIL